jgi:hypothetical protein
MSLPREGAPQLRAKTDGLELDIRALGSGQLRQRRGSNNHRAVAVPALAMQQRRGA